MATTIVRDHSKPILSEEKHLTIPGVGAQRPTVRERYDRAFAPVLVVDLGAVLGGDRACTHGMKFSISAKLDLPIVIVLKLLLISIQRKRSASQYIKGPQRNWSMYMIKEIDGLQEERTISADMILLIQGFEQSHLLPDIHMTVFHRLLD
jgi:hypothetical protein